MSSSEKGIASSKPLYQISEELLSVLAEIEESGEITDEVSQRISQLELSREEKVNSCAAAVRWLGGMASTVEAEIRTLQARARSLRNSEVGLKDYLKHDLEAFNQTRIELPLWVVRIQKNSVPSVDVRCRPEELPPHFQRLTVEADKEALREAWKRKEQLPPSVTVTIGTHLRIQ